jgi:endonuclease VIII
MPEGDTIRWHASRIAPALLGRAPERVDTHERFRGERWSERLSGRTVTAVDTHGKHLLLRFDGGMTLHSHLGMVGTWGVYASGRRWARSRRRAWIILGLNGTEVVEFDGSTLELVTDGRTRFDRRLAQLGPDVLADEFDSERFLRRLRESDPTRGVGDALLDQTIVAGIGNMWKAEACWDAAIDPWRKVSEVTDSEALALIAAARPRMLESAVGGPRVITPHVYKLVGRPCSRCGMAIRSYGQGDANRTAYWCPGCQI